VNGKKASSRGKAAGTRTIKFEDASLVQQCRSGDMQAFAALVAKYQDRIFNTIFRMCPQRADAEELAQETFLKALERIGQFRGRSEFYTWLFRIAVNLTISYRRRSGRIRFHSMTEPDGSGGGRTDALIEAAAHRSNPGPAAAVIAGDTNRRVLESLEELDDDFRAVVILRDMEDMDYARMGRILDLPVGTVKSRLHRARSVLKEKLKDLVN